MHINVAKCVPRTNHYRILDTRHFMVKQYANGQKQRHNFAQYIRIMALEKYLNKSQETYNHTHKSMNGKCEKHKWPFATHLPFTLLSNSIRFLA